LGGGGNWAGVGLTLLSVATVWAGAVQRHETGEINVTAKAVVLEARADEASVVISAIALTAEHIQTDGAAFLDAFHVGFPAGGLGGCGCEGCGFTTGAFGCALLNGIPWDEGVELVGSVVGADGALLIIADFDGSQTDGFELWVVIEVDVAINFTQVRHGDLSHSSIVVDSDVALDFLDVEKVHGFHLGVVVHIHEAASLFQVWQLDTSEIVVVDGGEVVTNGVESVERCGLERLVSGDVQRSTDGSHRWHLQVLKSVVVGDGDVRTYRSHRIENGILELVVSVDVDIVSGSGERCKFNVGENRVHVDVQFAANFKWVWVGQGSGTCAVHLEVAKDSLDERKVFWQVQVAPEIFVNLD